MPRVYEVARELGVTSKAVLEELGELGHPASSHASSIDDATAEKVRAGIAGPSVAPAVTGPSRNGVPPPPRAPESAGAAAVRAASEARPRPAPKKKSSLLRTLAELPLLVIFAFAIAIVIKTFLVQAFFIPSFSMLPTLTRGDRVLVEKLSYYLGAPERGEVVVFEKDLPGEPPDEPWTTDARNFLRELLGLPTGTEEDYIKRVVALGGDTISYRGSPRKLIVNGRTIPQPFIKGGKDRSSPTLTAQDCERLDMAAEGTGCRVPAGKIFVMGDNRGDSEDSRIIGPIDEDKVVGRAFVVIWPFGNFSGL